MTLLSVYSGAPPQKALLPKWVGSRKDENTGMTGNVPYGNSPKDPQRWVVFGVISMVYFLVYFHRVAPSVIVPDLLRAFSAEATALGFMASMYFYPYALEQPLVGYLADRLGPRRVVGLWCLGAAVGCGVFGLAPSLGWAAVGRAVIGFGVGGVFIPAMKAFSQWFPKGEFSGVVGLFLAVGNLGALFATTPLAWTAQEVGWRPTFLFLGLLSLSLGVVILACLRDAPRHLPFRETIDNEQHTGPGQVRTVLGTWRFWILFGLFFGVFGSYGTLQSLWATPFLMSALDLERLRASLINTLLPVGLILGAPTLGRWADRLEGNRVRLLLAVACCQGAIWILLALGLGSMSVLVSSITFLFFGMAAGGLATSFWGVVRAVTPARHLGITTGLLNPAPFLGSALMQVITGAILDHFGKTGDLYPKEAYQMAFLACSVAACIPCLVAVLLRRKLHPQANPAA